MGSNPVHKDGVLYTNLVDSASIFCQHAGSSRNKTVMKKILLFIIRSYQVLLSPFLGQRCRFEPTCSRYAAEAIDRHGPARGSWLAIKRISRCHPFCDGGYDPVPPRDEGRA